MTHTSARGPQAISALVSVTSVEDLSPTFRRVRMAGADLLGASPALIGEGPEITCADAYLKLLIPPPGRVAEHPDLSQGLPEWFALPAEQRGWLRTYTARSCRWIDLEGQRVPEIAIDVALHDHDAGPGGLWFSRASIGSTACLLVPGPEEPLWSSWAPGQAERVIAVGDETAAPALLSIAEQLHRDRPDLRADVIIEVPDDHDASSYPDSSLPRTPPDGQHGLSLHMLTRDPETRLREPGARALGELLGLETSIVDEALAGQRPSRSQHAETPEPAEREWSLAEASSEGTYVFLAGEAASIKAWRRMCVDGAGIDRSALSFMGYWRQGRAES